MVLIAEFRVELSVLREASTAVPTMEFTGEDIIVEDGRPRKFVLCATGPDLEEFERALSEDPTVAKYSVLQSFDEQAYYIVTYVRSNDLKGTYHAALDREIVYTDIRLRDGVYFVRAKAPDRDALVSFRSYCQESEIPFRIDRLYREAPSGDGPPLTEAQRQALRVAYENGYFDTPRGTTLEAVGEELGISRQAVSARLRRGYKQLIERSIFDEGKHA